MRELWVLVVVVAAGSACGSDDPDGSMEIGPSIERPPTREASAFNRTTEPNVASHGDDVVVAYRSRHRLSADVWQEDPAGGGREVAVAVSHDRGERFELVDVGLPAVDGTSDPVVVASSDGTFWLLRLGFVDGGSLMSLEDR